MANLRRKLPPVVITLGLLLGPHAESEVWTATFNGIA